MHPFQFPPECQQQLQQIHPSQFRPGIQQMQVEFEGKDSKSLLESMKVNVLSEQYARVTTKFLSLYTEVLEGRPHFVGDGMVKMEIYIQKNGNKQQQFCLSVRTWKGEKSTEIGVNPNEEMTRALPNLPLYDVEDTPKRKDDYDDLPSDELAVKSTKRKGDDESVVKSSKRKRPSNMKLSIEQLSNDKIQEAYSVILLNYISRKAKEYYADIGASLASSWKTWLAELEMFLTISEQSDSNSSDSDGYLYAMRPKSKSKTPKAFITVDGHKFEITVDTGASINVIDQSTFHKMKGVKLERTQTKAFAYNTDTPVDFIGKFDTLVETKRQFTIAMLYVTTDHDSGCLLSAESAQDLKLISIHLNKVTTPDKREMPTTVISTQRMKSFVILSTDTGRFSLG
eukprot:gene13141-biopygen10474